MIKEILLLFVLFILLSGCMTTTKKHISSSAPDIQTSGVLVSQSNWDLDEEYLPGPTTESQELWLAQFIQSAKSLRRMTSKLDLHPESVYRTELAKQGETLFQQCFFRYLNTPNIEEGIEGDLLDDLTRSLLLITQIQIETDTVDAEADEETQQNRKARQNIELLRILTAQLGTLDISDLDLTCANVNMCLASFEETTNSRK